MFSELLLNCVRRLHLRLPVRPLPPRPPPLQVRRLLLLQRPPRRHRRSQFTDEQLHRLVLPLHPFHVATHPFNGFSSNRRLRRLDDGVLNPLDAELVEREKGDAFVQVGREIDRPPEPHCGRLPDWDLRPRQRGDARYQPIILAGADFLRGGRGKEGPFEREVAEAGAEVEGEDGGGAGAGEVEAGGEDKGGVGRGAEGADAGLEGEGEGGGGGGGVVGEGEGGAAGGGGGEAEGEVGGAGAGGGGDGEGEAEGGDGHFGSEEETAVAGVGVEELEGRLHGL